MPESQQSLRSLLCNENRDFVTKYNGEEVKVMELEGKIVGLYFCSHWCIPCRSFTPELAEVYTKLLEKGDFEIIFVHATEDEYSFLECFKTMPWLALPFSDTKATNKLNDMFCKGDLPAFVVLDKDGRVICRNGVAIIDEYGDRAYPFSKERIEELDAEVEAFRQTQNLESLLVAPGRDFVIDNRGRQVCVSELVGKIVCLYFSAQWCPPCREFTPHLVQFYNELKKRGEDLEIVFLSKGRDENKFEEYFGSMPWVALPFRDPLVKKLSIYFGIRVIPALIVLGRDGKTLQTEAVEMITAYGVRVYPFTEEKLDELNAEREASLVAQTIESLLVSDERDFVIKHGGVKVPVSDLKGKTVGLYFSAHWCYFCQQFAPILGKVYETLKKKGEAFEIVFISCDKKQEAFEEYYSSMPWLALPFGDKTKKDLSRYFRADGIPYLIGIPCLVIFGPDGKIVTTNGTDIIHAHGAKAYPFTDARLLERQQEKWRTFRNRNGGTRARLTNLAW